MKTASYFTLVTISLASSICAGEAPVAPVTPGSSTDSGFDNQKWFGAPYIQFARSNSDTDLPGYPLGGLSYTHRFTADFDSIPGDVSSDQVSLWAPIAPLNRNNMHLFAFVNYEATQYNTSVPNLLPEDTLSRVNLPIVFLHDISENWIWGAMVRPTYAGSSQSSDDFTISAAIGAGYQYNPNLNIFAGAYYNHDFGENFFMPGVAFIWRPAPRWEAYLMGPIGGVSYSVNPNWMISLYGKYESPTWRVKADGSGPSRDVEMSSFSLGLKADYHLGGAFWAYAAGGISMFQQLEIEDRSDNNLQRSDIDPSPFVQAGLSLRF